MSYIFKKDFMWGAACSGPQTEGNTQKEADSTWEYWYHKNPEAFHNQVGNITASDFYNNYKELIPMMREAGITSYRTSIQWSRLITDCDGTISENGVAFYHSMIDELVLNGIEPMICLHHFDMPMYWMEKGGFENREVVDAFVKFAKVCFDEYGSKIKFWSTFNEPIVVAEMGYLYQAHYPLVVDMKRAVQVAYHIQVASSLTVELFHKGNYEGQIGIILNLTPSYPPKDATPEDIKACEIADLLFNRSFLDPSVKGEYPQELINFVTKEGFLPTYTEEDIDAIKRNRVDYLGVNYYQPRRIKARTIAYDNDAVTPDSYFEYYTFEGQRINIYRGWEIYEEAMYDIAINIRDNYGNIPWYISENGMGVENEERFLDAAGVIEDDYRIEFIREHLKYLHKGIEAGSNCFGYHLWAAFDNWSWLNSYKNRYGLIRVDIKDNCKLTPKKSSLWYKEVSDNGGFE